MTTFDGLIGFVDSSAAREKAVDSVRVVRAETRQDAPPEFDVIVIGAGVAGLYQLYLLRKLGLRVRVFETGSGIGGTWYWNRYPGAPNSLYSSGGWGCCSSRLLF